MGLLASLLPGLRDLRAPLVSGYLWLLAFWFASDGLPPREEATGLAARFYELEALITETGMLVVISVAAYLLGASTSTTLAFIIKQLERLRGRVLRDYERFLAGETKRLLMRHSKEAGSVDLEDAGRAERDLDRVRARLMAEQTMLYGEHDRLQSEAELRAAVVPPLFTIIVAAALDGNALIAFALVVCVAFILQALRLQSQADQALVAAVTSGKVNSPFLERVERDLAYGPDVQVRAEERR